MRTITGAILILTAEQAFAHAHLIGFPHQIYAQSILIPSAAVIGFTGFVVLIWGFFSERKLT
ncbi:MAG: hypothetical protein JSS49_30155 [Planctomycetes bacterium]|nr:hypothetical protein [Planctomycetota bacterium]